MYPFQDSIIKLLFVFMISCAPFRIRAMNLLEFPIKICPPWPTWQASALLIQSMLFIPQCLMSLTNLTELSLRGNYNIKEEHLKKLTDLTNVKRWTLQYLNFFFFFFFSSSPDPTRIACSLAFLRIRCMRLEKMLNTSQGHSLRNWPRSRRMSSASHRFRAQYSLVSLGVTKCRVTSEKDLVYHGNVLSNLVWASSFSPFLQDKIYKGQIRPPIWFFCEWMEMDSREEQPGGTI